MSEIVEYLNENLLPQLKEIASHLSAEYPEVAAHAHSYPVGSLTNYQGHLLCVDCTLKDAKDEDPDNVGLCIDLGYLTTAPTIEADVSWSHPSGYVEAEVFGSPAPLTEETIAQVFRELPRLRQALQDAVARRLPSSWGTEQP